MNGEHVGVRDPGHGLRFPHQGLVVSCSPPSRLHQLDRDIAAELWIVRGIDDPHRTGTDGLEQSVSLDPQRLCHRGAEEPTAHCGQAPLLLQAEEIVGVFASGSDVRSMAFRVARIPGPRAGPHPNEDIGSSPTNRGMLRSTIVHDDDRSLLRAWRNGDGAAGDVLVRRHFRTVHRFLRNKVDGDIDDLIQKTFLGCIEAIGRFREDARFKTFLLSIARNQLLLHYRASAQARRRPVAEISVQELGVSATPSTMLAGRQEQQVLLAALRMLPLDQQITLELFYWEDLSVDEVAGILQVAPGTIKSRLARAREGLREAIEGMDLAHEVRARTCDDIERWARSLRERAIPPSP